MIKFMAKMRDGGTMQLEATNCEELPEVLSFRTVPEGARFILERAGVLPSGKLFYTEVDPDAERE